MSQSNAPTFIAGSNTTVGSKPNTSMISLILPIGYIVSESSILSRMLAGSRAVQASASSTVLRDVVSPILSKGSKLAMSANLTVTVPV